MATGYAVPVELEDLARTFHERQLDEPSERWFGLIHEDAEMTLVVNGFQLCAVATRSSIRSKTPASA